MAASQRIASLLSSATEILYLLGLGDRVVGISHECDFPSDAIGKPRLTRSNVDSSADSLAIDRQVKALLESEQPLYQIDVQKMMSLQPDLIVTQAQCDVCAVRYADVLSLVETEPALRDASVIALNPTSLPDVLNDIERVALAAGNVRQGQFVAGDLRERVDAVRSRTTKLSTDERPRVACIEWTEPLMLAGNWMPDLVHLAGGRHDLTSAGLHSQYHSWDELAEYDPEVVVVMPCGFELNRANAEAKRLLDVFDWSNLSAVRQNRVYAVDANAYFNRPGPRLVDSLELLAHLLHPELVPIPNRLPAMTTYRAVQI